MGRTLNFTAKKLKGNFTKSNCEDMITVSKKYNSGFLKDVWTCENFYFSPVDYYPNWSKFSENMKSEKVWENIGEALTKERKKGKGEIEAILELKKKGLVDLHGEYPSNEVYAFCKTQGNEYNSLLVYTALLEISVRIPDCIITLYDEGEFLLCDLELKNGKVRPNIVKLKKEIERWSDSDTIKSYGKANAIKYLRLVKKKLETIQSIMEKSTSKGWIKPFMFARPVDVDAYTDYGKKGWSERLMDGFQGEAWGLTDSDPEKKAYEITSMLTKAVGKDCDLKILPNIKEL